MDEVIGCSRNRYKIITTLSYKSSIAELIQLHMGSFYQVKSKCLTVNMKYAIEDFTEFRTEIFVEEVDNVYLKIKVSS